VALTTVFRQLGDDRMTAILNEIREGVLLGHAQEQLNARTNPDFVPPEDEFWLTLAPTNRLVSAAACAAARFPHRSPNCCSTNPSTAPSTRTTHPRRMLGVIRRASLNKILKDFERQGLITTATPQ
jgi:hypothetical protein